MVSFCGKYREAGRASRETFRDRKLLRPCGKGWLALIRQDENSVSGRRDGAVRARGGGGTAAGAAMTSAMMLASGVQGGKAKPTDALVVALVIVALAVPTVAPLTLVMVTENVSGDSVSDP